MRFRISTFVSLLLAALLGLSVVLTTRAQSTPSANLFAGQIVANEFTTYPQDLTISNDGTVTYEFGDFYGQPGNLSNRRPNIVSSTPSTYTERCYILARDSQSGQQLFSRVIEFSADAYCWYAEVLEDGSLAMLVFNHAMGMPVTDGALITNAFRNNGRFPGYSASYIFDAAYLLVLSPDLASINYATYITYDGSWMYGLTLTPAQNDDVIVQWTASVRQPDNSFVLQRHTGLFSTSPTQPRGLKYDTPGIPYLSDTEVINNTLYGVGTVYSSSTNAVAPTSGNQYASWHCNEDGSDPNIPPLTNPTTGEISQLSDCYHSFLVKMSLEDGTINRFSWLPKGGYGKGIGQLNLVGDKLYMYGADWDNDESEYPNPYGPHQWQRQLVLNLATDEIVEKKIEGSEQRPLFNLQLFHDGRMVGQVGSYWWDPYGFGGGYSIQYITGRLGFMRSGEQPETLDQILFRPIEEAQDGFGTPDMDVEVRGGNIYVLGVTWNSEFPYQHELRNYPDANALASFDEMMDFLLTPEQREFRNLLDSDRRGRASLQQASRLIGDGYWTRWEVTNLPPEPVDLTFTIEPVGQPHFYTGENTVRIVSTTPFPQFDHSMIELAGKCRMLEDPVGASLIFKVTCSQVGNFNVQLHLYNAEDEFLGKGEDGAQVVERPIAPEKKFIYLPLLRR